MMLKSLKLLNWALYGVLASAACECGYETNDGAVWQYSLVTDFSQLTTAQWAETTDWSTSELVREATIPLNYTRENVVLKDGALQLTASAYNASNNEGISSGQIRTRRRDIQYGSFRATFSVVAESPGSVAGFFFYANDTQEIDIEVQSKMNDQTIHFGNQPSQNSDIYLPNSGVTSQIHEYRFDWVTSKTSFYADGVPSAEFTEDVPMVNGTISLNMWGNGGSFSGPEAPTTNNTMFISKIALYFNTSSTTDSRDWLSACNAMSSRLVCVVDKGGFNMNKTVAAGLQKGAENVVSAGNSHKAKGKLAKLLKKVGAAGAATVLYNI